MKNINSNPGVLETSEASTSEIDTSIADLRGGPGIVLLSIDTHLLHINRKGWELIKQINEAQSIKAGGLMPTAITQICAVHKTLQT
jgi:hypothetical protein